MAVEQLQVEKRMRIALANNLYLFRPSRDFVMQVLDQQTRCALSYDQVGASEHGPVEGWDWHRESRTVGKGEGVWFRSKEALGSWSQFDMSWVFPHDRSVPIEVGANFAFTSRHMGLWSVHVCRIVHTIDDVQSGVRRYGFAYGTLEQHAVRGEELFLLELDEVFGRVFRRRQSPHVLRHNRIVRDVPRRGSADDGRHGWMNEWLNECPF